MSMNDTLANVLSALYNAEITGKPNITIKPSSKTMKTVLTIMKSFGYIKEFTETEDKKGNVLEIVLSGKINKCGVIKPRHACKTTEYEKFEKRYLPAKGIGIMIVSTSSGMMTHEEALKKNLGGKLIAYCY